MMQSLIRCGVAFAAGCLPVSAWGTVAVVPSPIALETAPVTGAGNLVAPLSLVSPGFDIVLNYVNAPTAAEAAAFAAAETAWESVITGYQETVTQNHLTINVNLSGIDGVGGTLGSAGPTHAQLSDHFLYATAGAMTFDTADTAGLVASGNFEAVVLHEMGHVLGIGTLWSGANVGFAGYQELYVDGTGQYTGANAVAAYNDEFGQVSAFVPVELGGGGGTADGHWNEVDGGAGPTGITNMLGQDFRDELMTGWLNPNSFMSTVTIAGMQDLGYTVLLPEPGMMLMVALGGVSMLRRRRA